MKNFITGIIIASLLFFLGYLFDFDPVAFYVLSLFSAGIIVYGFPVFTSEDLGLLKFELSLCKSRIESMLFIAKIRDDAMHERADQIIKLNQENEALREALIAKSFNQKHLEELKASYSKEAEI